MQATRLRIPEVVLIEPKVFGDARGFFYESFNQRAFNEATGTNQINRRAMLREIQITANVYGRTTGEVSGDIRTLLDKIAFAMAKAKGTSLPARLTRVR